MDIIRQEPRLLIYVTASWCKPCQQLSPFMDSILSRGNIKILKLDYDKDIQTVSALRVRSVPILLYYQDGELEQVCMSGDVEQVKHFLSRYSII
jgi:thioredoxin 1